MSAHATPTGPGSGTSHESPPSVLRKVVIASMAGTVVEWYEFFLYASAATLVFGKPCSSRTPAPNWTAIIAAFLTYAVGFIARPHRRHRLRPLR